MDALAGPSIGPARQPRLARERAPLVGGHALRAGASSLTLLRLRALGVGRDVGAQDVCEGRPGVSGAITGGVEDRLGDVSDDKGRH